LAAQVNSNTLFIFVKVEASVETKLNKDHSGQELYLQSIIFFASICMWIKQSDEERCFFENVIGFRG